MRARSASKASKSCTGRWQRNARLSEPPEAARLPQRPRAADALHPPGLRLSRRRGARRRTSSTRSTASSSRRSSASRPSASTPAAGRPSTSFDDLMKVKGDEPPVAGYKLGRGLQLVRRLDPRVPAAAEKAGVMLALENHWGLTTTSRRCSASTRRSTPRGSASTSTPATSPATRTRASRSWRRTRRSCRPRLTTAAANGTRSTWTTSASRASCATPASRAGCRWRWKARRPPRRRCRRAWPSCAWPSGALAPSPIEISLTSRYSSRPQGPPSRPTPDPSCPRTARAAPWPKARRR